MQRSADNYHLACKLAAASEAVQQVWKPHLQGADGLLNDYAPSCKDTVESRTATPFHCRKVLDFLVDSQQVARVGVCVVS